MTKKFYTTFSALALACLISFSGIGGSYIQARAASGVSDILWNTEESVLANISNYILLFMGFSGVYLAPSVQTSLLAGLSASNFADFMLKDGYSQEQIDEVFRGGGGFVREGIEEDSDGSVSFSDEVSDLFHSYVVYYLSDYTDYIYVNLPTQDVISPTYFKTKESYDNFQDAISILLDAKIDVAMYIPYTSVGTYAYLCVLGKPNDNFDPALFCNSISDFCIPFSPKAELGVVYDEDWNYYSQGRYIPFDFSKSYTLDELIKSGGASMKPIHTSAKISGGNHVLYLSSSPQKKLFRDYNTYKSFNVGQQPYYVTPSFLSYDNSQNNAVNLTGQQVAYYQNNGSAIYNNIQSNINNYGTDITDDVISDIVKQVTDSIAEELKNQNNNDNSGGTGSDSGTGGTGVLDVLSGITKVFDVLLSLVGKVMGLVADFTNSILNLFSGFTTFTDGFTKFLSGSFAFIPQEIWNLISVGLSLMVLLAVLKFLRK